MKSFYFPLLLVLCGVMMLGCDSQSNIENPSLTHFIKFYGGDGDQTGVDMVGLSDGTFILFGTSIATSPDSTSQWYLVKTDAFGTVIWEKKFGSQTLNETASDIEITADGRLVAVGNSYKSSTDRDVMIMTFTLDGVPINKAIVALKNSVGGDTDENAISVSLTNDGFIVAGSTNNTDIKPNQVANDQRDALHLRFFNNLIQYPNTWGITIGPGTFDVAVKVIQISSTQFYVFGYSNSLVDNTHPKADFNYWNFGLGPDAVPNSNYHFIGSTTDDEKLSSVVLSPAQSGEGYFLGGITYNQSGGADLYVAKLRKTLDFNDTDNQFQKPLSISLGSNLSEHTSVFASRQSGFFVLANEKSFNDDQNWLLTKINNDGTIAWTLPLVFGGEGLDTIGSIQELPDGRIVIIGTMRTGKPDSGEVKMTLIKLNSNGKLSD
jgi:Domain of unknown function (DUF5122) beta-propeller